MSGSNPEVLRQFTEEFWNRGNEAFADRVMAKDVVHDQVPADWPQERAGLKRLAKVWRTGFPDMHEHLEFVLGDEDYAVGRFRLTGTHLGAFYGVQATRRPVEIYGVDVARFVDGQIVEYRYHEDTIGLFHQLGTFPADMSRVAGTGSSG